MSELSPLQLTILVLCLQHNSSHYGNPWLPPIWLEQNPEFETDSVYLMQQSLLERHGLNADGSRWLWAITEDGYFEVGRQLR